MLSVFLLHVLYPIVFLVAVIIIILNCFVVQKPVRVPRQVEKNNQIIIGLLRKKKFSFQDQGYFLIQTPNKKITVAAVLAIFFQQLISDFQLTHKRHRSTPDNKNIKKKNVRKDERSRDGGEESSRQAKSYQWSRRCL